METSSWRRISSLTWGRDAWGAWDLAEAVVGVERDTAGLELKIQVIARVVGEQDVHEIIDIVNVADEKPVLAII